VRSGAWRAEQRVVAIQHVVDQLVAEHAVLGRQRGGDRVPVRAEVRPQCRRREERLEGRESSPEESRVPHRRL
jgi:hypothetical protein